MEANKKSEVIPDNYTGKIIDIERTVSFASEGEAKAFYEKAKERLFNVNKWYSLAGLASAQFQLVDRSGNEVYRAVEKGDYFKIDIPGPGPTSGDGFDWVQVEEISEVHDKDTESSGIRVRPVPSPLNSSEDVAHFYSPESTSSFTIIRVGNEVKVGIYDRNTKPNTSAESIVDKVRDLAVGSGAVSAFSRIQWENLAEGILNSDV